jgi:glycerophosphoryl diester phosphodiesterase
MEPGAEPARPRARTRAALVVAHRGAWNPAPQNSLAAFERAIQDGADAVELDVRRTGDGRLIVIHDPRLGIRPIARLDHASVRARVRDGRALELADVLTALAGRIMVDIELKEDGYVGEAMTIVTDRLPDASYVVTSFRDAVLIQVRERTSRPAPACWCARAPAWADWRSASRGPRSTSWLRSSRWPGVG